MPSSLCIQCSIGDDEVEFPSVRELVEHQRGGHVTRPVKVLPPSRPVTPSATELAAEKADGSRVKVTTLPTGQVVKHAENVTPIVIKPLELQYKWVGSCNFCNTEPRTITVQVGEKSVVVAFCVNCNKELKQREVIPIASQFVVKEVSNTFEHNLLGKSSGIKKQTAR